MSSSFTTTNNDDQLQFYLNNPVKESSSLTLDSSDTLSASEIRDFIAPYSGPSMLSDNRFGYSNHSINPYDGQHWWIPMDHCYARPWNWRPESSFLKPTKTLFIPKAPPVRRKSADNEDLIDVTGVPEPEPVVYDKERALQLMDECERHAALARVGDADDDWEDGISKQNWTLTQHRLFTGMVSILNGARLGRLAYSGAHQEPIARRACVDKSVQKFRKLMSTIAWDIKYVQWLHQLLVDTLNTRYLAIYLDLLQTLKSKTPRFITQMMAASPPGRPSILTYESLYSLLKRPWDPVGSQGGIEKPKKLPASPVIVVIPSISISSRRMLKWINLLSHLAHVVTVPTNYGAVGANKISVMNYVDQMFVMTRNKIQEVRADHPGKSVCLVGFGFGATLALQVAQVEQVLCVVSVGFSLCTAEGRRGEADDSLLELQWPVLFVNGQRSSTSLQEDMEDLRERMRVETGLIIVGDADDNLRISKKKRRVEGISQSIVDRTVVDEIGEFIGGLILSPFPPQMRQSPTDLTTDGPPPKKMKTERKRYSSNASSLDSEPPSPTPRISRPVGRPPGSRTKPKWTQQGIPAPLPPNNTNPLQSLNTSNRVCSPITSLNNDTSSNDSSVTNGNGNQSDKRAHVTEPIPIKKIKTIVPVSAANHLQPVTPLVPSGPRVLNSALLKPNDAQPPLGKSSGCGITVLENLKLDTSMGQKYYGTPGKVLDMSKVSVINPKSGSSNSIVLLPDGKIKNIGPQSPRGGRYITSKRQLIGARPPKPIKKSYVSQMSSVNLPPPANLTTEDIMDLPIIFADDNQMIDPNLVQPESPLLTNPIAPLPSKVVNKFMVVNKTNNPTNYVISSQQKQQPKFTKIILSSKKPEEKSLLQHLPSLSSEISIKKVQKGDNVDLEREINASTVYRTVRIDHKDDTRPKEM